MENINVPAGEFKDCLKITSVRDDVYPDLIVTVTQTQWLAKGVGIVKYSYAVKIYSPKGGAPFLVNGVNELVRAKVGGKVFPK
jgi:hypothetical protein